MTFIWCFESIMFSFSKQSTLGIYNKMKITVQILEPALCSRIWNSIDSFLSFQSFFFMQGHELLLHLMGQECTKKYKFKKEQNQMSDNCCLKWTPQFSEMICSFNTDFFCESHFVFDIPDKVLWTVHLIFWSFRFW